MAFKDLAALEPEETLPFLTQYQFPPYITYARIFNAPNGWSMTDRVLKQYVFEFIVEGKGKITIEGHSYNIRKGDLIFYRPDETHSIERFPDHPYIAITVVFHFHGFPFPFEQLFYQHHYLGNFDNHPIEHHFSEIVAKYSKSEVQDHIRCQGLLLLIFSQLGDHLHQEKSIKPTQNIAKLIQIKNYIRENLDQNIDPELMEMKFNVNWRYTISRFSKTFGLSPGQFLIWERVAKAKELALNTTLSVSEIAVRVGYSDVHTFGKMFKKKTNMSLTEFCASMYDLDRETRIQFIMQKEYGYEVKNTELPE